MPILIVGLGNPGSEYANTRHNAGFLALDRLAKQHNVTFKFDKRANAEVAEANIDGKKIILAKPQTFMNRSGESVASLAATFKVEPKDIWAVYDDAAIEDSQVRVRVGGTAGGHNGVKSLIEHLGENFTRFRLGIGAPPERVPLEDYVLQPFGQDGLALMEKKVVAAIELIEKSLVSDPQETTVEIS